MEQRVNLCEDCGDCQVCHRTDRVEFPWDLRIYELLENGRKSYEFFLEKDGDVISEGSAHGILSIFDLAREAIFESGLVKQVGSPSSFTDIAFDSGRIHERQKLTTLLRGHLDACNFAAVNDWPCDVCAWASSTIEEVEASK